MITVSKNIKPCYYSNGFGGLALKLSKARWKDFICKK